jgi:MoaA/NifB/PqqE/SkfB family radical SAM enzyme
MLHAKLQLLRDVQRVARATTPRLRVIFTWMRSIREELRELPRFARELGAQELDVRYVIPAMGVDNASEVLTGGEPSTLRAELGAVARDAVRRGLRLAAWPLFDDRPARLLKRIAWRWWRMRVARHERDVGCRYPDRMYVIRPSGAVFPCEFYDQPIGFAPVDSLLTIAKDARMTGIRDALRCGSPAGSCATCSERRDAFYSV